MLSDIEAVKGHYGLDLRHPVKYNMKDGRLDKYYEARGESPLLVTARASADAMRTDLLALLPQHNARTFICAMGSLGFKTRKEYYQWATTNLLQRLGYLTTVNPSHQIVPPELLVCLDWPDANIEKNYFHIYHEPWHTGVSVEGHSFTCGPLRHRKAFPDVVVGSTIHNSFLQLADLVAGAAASFVTWAVTGNKWQTARMFFTPVATCFFANAWLRHNQTSFISSPPGLQGIMATGYASLSLALQGEQPPITLPA